MHIGLNIKHYICVGVKCVTYCFMANDNYFLK